MTKLKDEELNFYTKVYDLVLPLLKAAHNEVVKQVGGVKFRQRVKERKQPLVTKEEVMELGKQLAPDIMGEMPWGQGG